jgi:hypothetical protein
MSSGEDNPDPTTRHNHWTLNKEMKSRFEEVNPNLLDLDKGIDTKLSNLDKRFEERV